MLCFNAFLGISEVTCRSGVRCSNHGKIGSSGGKSTARAKASPMGKPGKSGTGDNGGSGSPDDTPSSSTEDANKSNSNKQHKPLQWTGLKFLMSCFYQL